MIFLNRDNGNPRVPLGWSEDLRARGPPRPLSFDWGRYQGARPVTYFQKDRRRPQAVRYTPFQDRADWLFARFLEDMTDPAALAGGSP